MTNTALTGDALTLERCVVRDTASRRGRTRAVAPGATSAAHLHYGRIILDGSDAPLFFRELDILAAPEHAALAEEAYLYIDMPPPAFGLQLVCTDKTTPELAVIVREGDVVLTPQGYHPNVAAPGGSINFLWMMAANRETEDRLFGVVNVHPDFVPGGSGLEAGRSGKK